MSVNRCKFDRKKKYNLCEYEFAVVLPKNIKYNKKILIIIVITVI